MQPSWCCPRGGGSPFFKLQGDPLSTETVAMWELGNYGRVAELITGIGHDLVAAAEIRPGQRVLDVAAGTGNAAIPAARAGAVVTALDSAPRLLADGRRVAGDLPITWVEGDAGAM